MKKAVKDYGIICLSVLCWLLLVGAGSFAAHDTHRNTHADKHATYSSVSHIRLIPGPQSENAQTTYSGISYPAVKEAINRLWAASRITEHLRESRFSRYVSLLIDFPVNRRKVELLYPFDYFW